MRFLLGFFLLGLGLAAAQPSLYRIPDSLLSREGGAVTFHGPQGDLVYIEGLGWRDAQELGQPVVSEEGVYGPEELLRYLGVTAPTLTGARFGGSGTVRIVLDIAGLPAAALGVAERQGRLEDGEVLRLTLPRLELPLELPDPYRGVGLELLGGGETTEVEVTGGEASYHVFTLEEPTRLVIDVTPHAAADVEAETRLLRPGVLYRRFAAPTAIGSSGVHVLEMSPQSGEFRVVGASEEPRPVSALTSGAFAGINAGYFDTQTFGAIGLLKVDGGLLSLPSRRRASIGFVAGEAVIDRVEATVNLRIDGRFYQGSVVGTNGSIRVASSGPLAGTPTEGVITVSKGRVVANRVGPQPVPAEGFAVVYAPEERALALVEPGAQAALEIDFDPASFARARYAVEAGPMLVENGLPAFAPDEEQFVRGERILDEYTQQAAIGVRRDGTVLFVVAENMVAEELVPLMLFLDAQEAMRLDSGGSTTLVVDGEVLNRSSERKVVSAIVFVPYAN